MKTLKMIAFTSLLLFASPKAWAQNSSPPPPAGVVAQPANGARPWLGVSLAKLNRGSRHLYKMPFRYGGVLVKSVTSQGPAKKAGIRRNDVIVRINGKYVYKPKDVIQHILKHRPGQRIKVDVYRWGQWKPMTVLLSARRKNRMPLHKNLVDPFAKRKTPPANDPKLNRINRRQWFVRRLIAEVRSLRKEVNELKRKVHRLQKRAGIHRPDKKPPLNKRAPSTVPPPAPDF